MKPSSTVVDEDNLIDLSDDDYDSDALENIIKSKQEDDKRLKNLPLFDPDILHNFIDEWFEDPTITIDDLQLPIGISVTFQGFVGEELTITQKAHEQKAKIRHENALF